MGSKPVVCGGVSYRGDMSLSKIHRLCRKILPLNYGMNSADWLNCYNSMYGKTLCPDDPSLWTDEQKAEVDANALLEDQLAARLMALSDEDFYAEVTRLESLMN